MTGNQRSDRAMPQLAGNRAGNACVMKGLCGAGTADQGANPGLVASSSAWLRRRLAPNRRPKRPNRTPARDPGPFNAHNPDGGRSGLVQHVFGMATTPREVTALTEFAHARASGARDRGIAILGELCSSPALADRDRQS